MLALADRDEQAFTEVCSMPPFDWPNEPVGIVQEFEARHRSPASGALLLFAVWTVDSLYYLNDVDGEDDLSQPTNRGHRPDVVDVAHARWATASCTSALDLCAAAFGRALCGHTKRRELDLAAFQPNRLSDPTNRLRASLPRSALLWIDQVISDQRYRDIKEVRNLLTHARVSRHFSMPRRRLRLDVGSERVEVPVLLRRARDLATDHVSTMLTILPTL